MQPWIEACDALSAAGVPYVIIGAFGINVHAGSRGPLVATGDCDLLLRADPAELARAVATLRGLGYELEAGEEPLPDEDPPVMAGIVSARACVRARRGPARIDLLLEMTGGRFEDLWARRKEFVVEDVVVHVAPLEDIVRSKQLADRPKDRATLEALREELEDLLGGSRPE